MPICVFNLSNISERQRELHDILLNACEQVWVGGFGMGEKFSERHAIYDLAQKLSKAGFCQFTEVATNTPQSDS